MKLQRKLVTHEQKMQMCDKYQCIACPMTLKFKDTYFDCVEMQKLEQALKDYWNEEIEVNE